MRSCVYDYKCVFFFKQKTAYEVRISDWSSDVCSSDLLEARKVRACAGFGIALTPPIRSIQNAGQPGLLLGARSKLDEHRAQHRQIGRASCRERVCQSV